MFKRALLTTFLGLAACGPKTEPVRNPEPAPSAAPTPEPVPPVSEAQPPSEPAVPANPAPEAKPAAPSIHDVCYAMCDKVKVKCPQSAFESCRVNCTKFDPPPKGCDDVVRSALECARDAADLVCANVAPESCGKRFRQITACASGEKLAASSEPASAALPAGFAMYENASEGLHAPMPQGAAPGAEGIVATAKDTGGAVYTIRKLPRPAGKVSEKVFLKVGMNLLGRCSDKMKLQGMVDKPGRTSINYTTKCPDGALEQGLFWATDKAIFVASVRGAAGSLGAAETFLYGFEAK
ncbi:MAG TPA: hypothetical protein VJN18_10960 [Polyangiaceae bacterium]|nr:hypothetical protein [Polyangiaceae bacterium]